MAKNIVIAEGGTAKNFTAKKLKTNQQGSGTVDWIPEDEAVDYVDIKDHTFRAAGTFKPEDFNCDGFGEVTIDIPADVKPKTITANGEFYAADDGCLGYSKVTVAVPTGGGGGPYTVRFFDDDRQTILKTDANVPYAGSASCTLLDGTVKNGLYFKGWNPTPINVRENMNCYPVRGDYVIDSNEIQDDWETICALKGAGYPLGSYKALVFTISATTNDVIATWDSIYNGQTCKYKCHLNTNYTTFCTVDMHMVKVAEGEDGSTSTWISTGCFYLPNGAKFNIYRSSDDGETWSRVVSGAGIYDALTRTSSWYSDDWGNYMHDWFTSKLRSFLNGLFFDNLYDCLRNAIKPITKSYWGFSNAYSSATRIEKTSIDSIWIPSMKELKSMLSSYSVESGVTPSTVDELCEINGIDYTQVYAPTYPIVGGLSWYITRTIGKTTNSGTPGAWITPNSSNSKIGNLQNYWGDNANRKIPFGFCL